MHACCTASQTAHNLDLTQHRGVSAFPPILPAWSIIVSHNLCTCTCYICQCRVPVPLSVTAEHEAPPQQPHGLSSPSSDVSPRRMCAPTCSCILRRLVLAMASVLAVSKPCCTYSAASSSCLHAYGAQLTLTSEQYSDCLHATHIISTNSVSRLSGWHLCIHI